MKPERIAKWEQHISNWKEKTTKSKKFEKIVHGILQNAANWKEKTTKSKKTLKTDKEM